MEQNQFINIVNDYKDLIYNQAYYFTNNKQDAEDITQDVLVKLWHNFSTLKKRFVKSWIIKVTRNTCIDFSRKKKENVPAIHDNNEEEIPFGESLIDLRPNPEQKAISNDINENITKLIGRLPDKMRSIIIMKDVQDLKYDFIAETMDLPLNSVKVYIHRGRKLLLKYFLSHFKNELE